MEGIANYIRIETESEYDYCVSRGFEPLTDDIFILPIELRQKLIKRLISHGNLSRADDVEKANERFYRFCWEHKAHRCEECLRELEYSSVHISHILPRGAHPEMAYDPRNTNILCWKHHAKWENGNRQEMRIYKKNLITIEKLRNDYESRLNRR